MAKTLEGSRLKEIRVFGQQLPTSISEHCISASLSLSNSQITQMQLVFADTHSGMLHNSGVLADGTLIDYGGWKLEVDDSTFGPGSTGPTLSIKAPSRLVKKLQSERGAYNWGVRDVSRFVYELTVVHGFTPHVQLGLGSREIIREGPTPEAPDTMPQSSWDVLTRLAQEVGCWLFEVQDHLFFGKPTWLRDNTQRRIPLYWNSWTDYSPALSQMPTFSGSGAGEKQQLQISLIAPDADEITPGDIVTMSGSGLGRGNGTWIVTSVSYPMTVAGPVSVNCERVTDPAPGGAAASASGSATLGVGATNWASGNFTGAGFASDIAYPQRYTPGSAYEFLMNLLMQQEPRPETNSAGQVIAGVGSVDAFVAKYLGRPIDRDGAYGAQCVDLSAQYIYEVFGLMPASGNGKDIFYNQGGVQKVPASSPGKPGDVACWGSALGGGYGHVAIVLGDAGSSLSTLSQNPGPPHYEQITKVGLQGYLRSLRPL